MNRSVLLGRIRGGLGLAPVVAGAAVVGMDLCDEAFAGGIR